MRDIETENLVRTIAGRAASIRVPIVPDDAPPALRIGLLRHRAIALDGSCPCGAVRPDEAVRDPVTGMDRRHVQHRPACPAHADLLGPQIEAWQQQEGAADGAQAG